MGKEANRTKLRDGILEKIAGFLGEEYDTYVRPVASGEYTMLIEDEEGNKIFANVKVSIPRGTRNGNGGYNAYDGYALARGYAEDLQAKAQEAEIKKANKEQKKTKEQKQVAKAIENLEKAGLG